MDHISQIIFEMFGVGGGVSIGYTKLKTACGKSFRKALPSC